MKGEEIEEQAKAAEHHVVEFCGRSWSQSQHYHGAWLLESTAGDWVEFRHKHPPIMDDWEMQKCKDATNREEFFQQLVDNSEALAEFIHLLRDPDDD